ncbi:MAG: cell division protein FtsA [Gemmatimonadetes bacterium]|nr:MAG: cell division protein FtsA [Gemmatimonadota bacterium]
MARTHTIVGLDIGTTKIGAIIAEVDSDGQLNVVGVGKSPSHGLRRGVVVNLEKTVQSITTAVEEAELMAGVEVHSVYAGIAGDHIRSINSRGVIAVSRQDNEITKTDIVRVIDAAKAVAIPMDREIIHVLPQEFIVDDQGGITDPVGMSGVRLEAEVHIVTGAVTSAQNIYKAVRRAGLEVSDIVLEPLASSYAVLDDDEKELGVALLDIGGGTADVAIFHGGSIRHTAVIGLGGDNVTQDISVGLRTPLARAEELKKQHGCALKDLVDESEMIMVPGVGGREPREVPRLYLADIIEARMEEIFHLTLREIRKTDYADLLNAGLVITGGASTIEGAPELAEQVFHCPVKRGIPRGVGGLSESVSEPMYATGVGLVLYGRQFQNELSLIGGVSDERVFEKILNRMKKWMDFF